LHTPTRKEKGNPSSQTKREFVQYFDTVRGKTIEGRRQLPFRRKTKARRFCRSFTAGRGGQLVKRREEEKTWGPLWLEDWENEKGGRGKSVD